MKKIMAIILSLCLIVCAVPILNISAATWSLTEKDGYLEDVTTLKKNAASITKLTENGKGILAGAIPYTYNYSANKSSACPSITNATDGLINEFYPYTGLYSYVTFQLTDIYNLTEFGLILNNANYRNSYEVYVGNSYDTLYTGTPVYVFDGTAEGYTSSMGQYVQFVSDETHTLPQGSIIGIKFTECMNSSGVIATANRAVRVAEIFANGTPTNSDVEGMGLALKTYDAYYYNYQSISDDNLLKHSTLYSFSGISKDYAKYLPTDYVDGNPVKECYLATTESNPTLTFELRAETEIHTFKMFQSDANYRSSYRVYIGNDPDTLYSEENLIYTSDGATNLSTTQEYFFNANRKSGKYMGIYFDELTNHASVTSGLRLAEVFVDGKELDSETYNSPRATVEARISADNNLLKGKSPVIMLEHDAVTQNYGYAPGNNFPYLTNGTVINTGHCDIYGYGNDYMLFVYSLGGTATVEAFELFNRAAAQNSSYEVYIGDSVDGILSEDNLIYSYDGSTDIDEAYRCQYVHFGAPKVGSYIAIKLLQTYGANTSSNNFRISEIAAYGTVTEPAAYELHSTRLATAYTDSNLLLGLTTECNGYTTADSGWETSFTDGIVSSKKDIKGITVGTTTLTYDIGYTAVFDKFVIGNYGGYATGIEYYVSHDKDTLYNSENLVAVYDLIDTRSKSENYDASVVFADDAKPVGRYLGLRIVDSSSTDKYLRLFEISAIGEKAPMELTPHNYDGFATAFEDGDSANGIGGTAYTATDESDANVHSGSASRLHAASSEAAEWVVEDYKLEANRTYDISLWYKAEGDAVVGSVNGNEIGASQGEWKEYKETVTTTEEGNLSININATDVDVYIDDISIVPVITVINDGVVGGSGKVEITTNEDGKKIATFTATRDFGYALKNWVDMAGNVVSEDDVYVAVNPWPGYTLKPVFVKQQLAFDFEDENIIIDDAASWYSPETEGFTYKFVYSGNKSIKYNVSNSTITLPVDLAAGETYTVSFKYITEKTGVSVSAGIGLNGTAADTVALSSESKWQICSVDVTTTADSDEATITFSGDNAVIYIDDICVEPVADQGKISVSVGSAENGTANVDDDMIVPEQPVKFTAAANDGYVFDKWINEEGETVSFNSTFVMLGITEDTTLTPVFVKTDEPAAVFGFESAVDGKLTGVAEIYTPQTPAYDGKYVHWGKNSIRMDGYGASYTHSYILKAGQSYKVAFWYFLPETTTATISFTLGDTTQMGCTATGLWNERFYRFTPEKDMQLTIDVSGINGPVYIDDIIIEPYHTVSVADSISTYVSVSTVEPLHGETIIATAKKAIGEHELFYGWLKDAVVNEAANGDVEFTVTEDMVIDEELIGKPVYTNRYDTNNDGNQDIADLVYANRKTEYVLGSDVDRSGAIDDDDIIALRRKVLGFKTSSEREAYLSQPKNTVVGSNDDLTTWIYELGNTNIHIREAEFDSGKNDGETVEIIQLTDVHFNTLNERDYADANPTVLSSAEKHTAGNNGSHVERAVMCMEYANKFYDQTVITGDNMSFQTWGGIEQIKEKLWGMDPSALITLGNHDMMQRMQGIYPETTELESRYSTLQENWRHDVYYTSRVIKEKVMVIQMDNALSYYTEYQAEKLAADIEKARENGYIILIFQHVPIVTNNPKYSEIRPLHTSDSSIVYNFSANADANGNRFDGIRTNRNDVTTKVYNLITQNADVIKGLFCGHYHNDFYCEVIATEKDGTETVIPQYVVSSTAYDSGIGHAMKITVK